MNEHGSGDPLLDEVDEARRRILAECGNDPEKVLESYFEFQKQFADRLVSYQNRSTAQSGESGQSLPGNDPRGQV